MLTFEEFFAKKKINLLQFQAAKPDLFAEFAAHYPLMGEKSFDHTKKYWFNQLRRSFPLSTEIKPHAVKAEAISAMAIQGMSAAAAQNLDETLEKPKFTEDHLAELVDENVSVKEVSLAEEEKAIIETEPEKSEEKTSEEQETTKPVFKPRFKMQNIKKDVLKEASETEKSEENESEKREIELSNNDPKPETEPSKPVFKPRFKMQNIKKDVVKEASETETSEENESEKRETEPSKPVFKPRFKMQNIKKDVVKEASEIEAEKSEENESEAQEPETKNVKSSIETAENAEAKPIYKPRFQMKNLPKPAAENQPPTAD